MFVDKVADMVAITTLRIAARHTEQDDTGRITADIIESAFPEARQEFRQKNIDALTPHQRAVYNVIDAHGEIAPGNLYQEYRQRVEDPKVGAAAIATLTKLPLPEDDVRGYNSKV